MQIDTFKSRFHQAIDKKPAAIIGMVPTDFSGDPDVCSSIVLNKTNSLK